MWLIPAQPFFILQAMTNEQLVEAGVDPSMIRFSVGIEDAEDIIEDIREALEE